MDADRIEGKAVLEIEKEIDKYDDVLKSGIKKVIRIFLGMVLFMFLIMENGTRRI